MTDPEVKKAEQLISEENHKLLLRMGKGLKGTKITGDGIIATSDWSWYTQRMCFSDANFWRIFSMLFLSVTYDFFMKISFKVYGALYHDDDLYLTQIGMQGYFFAGVARMCAPLVMQKIGFFKTYTGCLVIQAFLAFTVRQVVHYKLVYQVYCVVSMMCEGTHFSIFPPLSGAIYGPV
jgi:hypothetical protein